MKTKLFTIALALLGLKTFSQITVTDNDILSIGDIMHIAETDSIDSSINIGNSGPNQNWDFSTLQITNVETLQCIDPNGTPHSQYYPNANLCIEESGDYLYFNKSSSKVEMLGEGDSVFQQPIVVLPLSLTYGATYTDGPIMMLDSIIGGPVVNLILSSQGITANMISLGAAHTADTLNIQLEFVTDFDVDAWGSMTIPMGTFNCLRLKIERTSNSIIQVYCSDTITGNGSGWYTLPWSDLDQEISYQWWSNDVSAKFALAEVQVDSIGNIDNSVRFLHNSASNIQNASVNSIKAYPIPTTYMLYIDTDAKKADYKIYDMTGQMVLHKAFSTNKTLNLSNIKKGTYLLHITTEKGSITKKVIVE
jgi:hypothetical protein